MINKILIIALKYSYGKKAFGESINKGVQLSNNDYILVLSAHVQIIEFDFKEMKQNLKNHKAVFGKQIPVHRGKKITPGYIWSNFGDKEEINLFSKIEKRLLFNNRKS